MQVIAWRTISEMTYVKPYSLTHSLLSEFNVKQSKLNINLQTA